ncbi:MAG: hypothetical protein AUI52_05445 [Acidobacteria bacterium 13_1_40CM_2_68_10]|nr:MAG: hypothetical protein AUI52_05445 [Acidobacteria bacterium 13_1_40CM_2_68_10]
MGTALEVISGFTTAAGATQTALTMATGDSLTIRATLPDKKVWLLNTWVDAQAAGVLRIKSPKLHDAVHGIRLRTTISEAKPLLPMDPQQRLYPQDVLSVDLSGSATAGDIETAVLLIYYEDLPGIMARLIGEAELGRRIQNVFGVETDLTAGTAGGWSGSRAVNADFDVFKANTDYALMGYLADVETAAISWKGADTGNLRVGGPGDELARHLTAEWFVRLSRLSGIPMIPVFNSANKAAITIEVASDENAASPKVTSLFAELGAPRPA